MNNKNNGHKGNQYAVGHNKPKVSKLLFGDGCTIDGISYKCLENCPFPDDCHYEPSNNTVSKRINNK